MTINPADYTANGLPARASRLSVYQHLQCKHPLAFKGDLIQCINYKFVQARNMPKHSKGFKVYLQGQQESHMVLLR